MTVAFFDEQSLSICMTKSKQIYQWFRDIIRICNRFGYHCTESIYAIFEWISIQLDRWIINIVEKRSHNYYHGSGKNSRWFLCTFEHLNLFTHLREQWSLCCSIWPFYDNDGNQRVKNILRNKNRTDGFMDLLKVILIRIQSQILILSKVTMHIQKCTLNVNDLNETNKLVIQEFYTIDFESFGYDVQLE